MKKVDMSEKAIISRLRQVDKLRELCLALMKAKKLQDEDLQKKNDSANYLKPKTKNTETIKS